MSRSGGLGGTPPDRMSHGALGQAPGGGGHAQRSSQPRLCPSHALAPGCSPPPEPQDGPLLHSSLMILCKEGVTRCRKGSSPTWVLTTLVTGGRWWVSPTCPCTTAAGKMNQARPLGVVTLPRGAGPPVPQCTHLAHGLIFRASPRLMQKPAPPVANQKWTGRCGRGSVVRLPDPTARLRGGCRPSNPRGTGLCGWNTHHLGLADPLRGLDGPVQAGLAQVDVLCVRVTGQQPQQGPHVHVVIIIHVAEPPGKRQAVRAPCGGGAGWEGRSRGRSPARGRGHRWAPAKGRHSLSPGFDEAVVLHGHLAGQRLAAVGGRAVSIDHVACGQGEGL